MRTGPLRGGSDLVCTPCPLTPEQNCSNASFPVPQRSNNFQSHSTNTGWMPTTARQVGLRHRIQSYRFLNAETEYEYLISITSQCPNSCFFSISAGTHLFIYMFLKFLSLLKGILPGGCNLGPRSASGLISNQ